VLPNIHIADCGHKIGLNGVDNGRIWWVILFLVFCILIYVICCISHPIFHLYTRFQNIRVPRENLLNLVADVLPDGQYVSMIDDPDQVPLLPLNMLMWLMRFCSFFLNK
jgi:acyl-CoA oxidase